MEYKELQSKPAKELEKLLREKRKALRLFRFGSAGSRTKNVKEGRSLRRDIARILTKVGANKIAS
ncbi:MAG: 50S ribosomal protein L29 [Parcubacteria group bacterium]|nr:50S ribosomal protein L29 [Parcubacteria group bacterium]